jgi:hypothetical protein
MATFLDVGLLSAFGTIFTFILVWIIVYGLLEYTKVFGDKKQGINGLVAFSSAMLVLASQYALKFVNFVVPWFMILAIAIFLILFVFRVFGIKEDSFVFAGKEARMWIIVLSIVILMFGFGSVFGQTTLNRGASTNNTIENGSTAVTNATNTGSFSANLYNTLFHPKVLGLLLIFIIGILALVFLTSK